MVVIGIINRLVFIGFMFMLICRSRGISSGMVLLLMCENRLLRMLM